MSLQQMDVSQGTWFLISLTKFITYNFCLLCIFLYPKLWIKLRCYKVLHSIKMQRKWYIYSSCLQNPTTFCTQFLISCPSWISFTAQENPLSSARGWGPHTGWSKGLKANTEQIAVSWDDSLVSCPWHHRAGPAALGVLLDICSLAGELCCGQGWEVLQKHFRRSAFVAKA